MEYRRNYPQEVTLTNCDKEPIHLIGKTQGFGFFLAFEKRGEKFSYWSQNALEFLDLSEDNLIQKNPKDVLGAEVWSQITTSQSSAAPEAFQRELNGTTCVFLSHHSGEYTIVEIEPLQEPVDALGYQMQLSHIFNQFSETKSDQELCESAAVLIKEFLGYDRVMIYRFDEQYNGEVVAEAVASHLDPYLGLRYPATDIPKQARKLFLTKGVRIITDVTETPVEIHGLSAADTIDLTNSELRASSPIHIEYLKNMGVAATLTAAIKDGDQLWGLVACHHYSPKTVNYYKRMSCKFLTQVFSTQLMLSNNNKMLQASRDAGVIQSQLIAQASENWNIIEGLLEKTVTMLDLVRAKGAAVSLDGKIHTLGQVPTQDKINGLLDFLATEDHGNDHFLTKNLSEIYPGGNAIKETASGVMLLWLNRELQEALIWFKPEEREEVIWAGNPDKAAQMDEKGQLRPRSSFAEWTQVQSGIAAPWYGYELDAAKGLKERLLGIVLKKYDEVLRLHEQLQQAYKELELFSYAVSHDLRSPLHGIYGFAKILEEDYAKDLDNYGKISIESIVGSTERMNRLIDDILQFAHRSREEVRAEKVDMYKSVQHVLFNIKPEINHPKHTIQVDEGLPETYGDPSMLYHIWSNLVDNAIKYSATAENPKVEIGFLTKNDETQYFVKDNGIGFDMDFKERIFDIFVRLSGESYSGSGIGLALAKQVVEKHEGRIWAESIPGKQTVFYFTINPPS